ncbi:uncharacterized protein CLAFUR5_07556 [Fulvia fulva]|uniref:Methylated-DNA--protein-cysteine methyltransferase n=1 Tax=Passalora fulva TaxID=5499 RepID=A0A9Q8UQU9_PASFU|nr:uncharacterized protein CLAFUR5_07556 [Fulvia fulva]KAK4622624.1 hypothetical protein CLAFUR0_07432 [Fulvia fulva]UJO19134.1 hypothetical protein CLAFUR5_07556 [Fulvia fulva]WPV31080.1 hypothetical protein CLAFUW7_07429 [Fulvia fulva]
MATLTELQDRWKYLFQEYLPCLAKAKDPVQPHWPVHLDHCFGRIVLDNAVGIDKPWTEVLKSPAIRNMNQSQLQKVISLAEAICSGEANLVKLDENSLQLRGKKGKKRKADESVAPKVEGKKKKTTKLQKSVQTVSAYFLPSTKPLSKGVKQEHEKTATETIDAAADNTGEAFDMEAQLKRIDNSDITAFRKRTLSLLCKIPRGRYSTYGAMSDWISANSHKTCARAVGNAMRNNPFAPEVPCHRILAGDGTLGGFKGSWGEEGKYAKHKHELLHAEGVRFDSKGKVKGPPFRDFK